MSGYPTNRDLVHHRQNKVLNVQPIPSIYLAEHEKPSLILFRNQDLFLAQKIEVGLAAGASRSSHVEQPIRELTSALNSK